MGVIVICFANPRRLLGKRLRDLFPFVSGGKLCNKLFVQSTLFPMIGCVQGVPQLSTLFYIGSDLAGNSSMTMLVPGIRGALWLIVCFLFSKIILCKQIFFLQSCEYYLLVKSFAFTCGLWRYRDLFPGSTNGGVL